MLKAAEVLLSNSQWFPSNLQPADFPSALTSLVLQPPTAFAENKFSASVSPRWDQIGRQEKEALNKSWESRPETVPRTPGEEPLARTTELPFLAEGELNRISGKHSLTFVN